MRLFFIFTLFRSYYFLFWLVDQLIIIMILTINTINTFNAITGYCTSSSRHTDMEIFSQDFSEIKE